MRINHTGSDGNGHSLYFGDYSVVELAKKLGTPFFLYDQEKLEQNYGKFVAAFSRHYENIRIYFSAKTACELEILRLLHRLNSCAEMAAGHELELLLSAGFKAEQIVFDRPCMSESDIRLALDKGIHAFHVDSIDELEKLNRLAKTMGKLAPVAFRVNPRLHGFLPSMAEYYIGRFGLTPEDILEAYARAKAIDHIRLIGLMVHIGSQVTTPTPYLKAITRLVDLAKALEERGADIKEINLGGGYPSQTLIKTTLLSLLCSHFGIRLPPVAPLEVFGEEISKKFKHEVQRLKSRPLLAFEPGRCIVSDAAIAVATVCVVKGRWLFLDISNTSLPESLFFAQRRMVIANKARAQSSRRYHVAGSSLNSADILARNVPMPAVQRGDLVVILDAGAYSLSRASRFTSLNPQVYLIGRDKKIRTIRRAEQYEDVYAPMDIQADAISLE